MSRLVALVIAFALPFGAVIPATALPNRVSETVLVNDFGVGIIAVDSTTGEHLWLAGAGARIAAAKAHGEAVYVTISDGDRTDVFASVAGAEPRLVETVDTTAVVAGLDAAGSTLFLLELPAPVADSRIGPPVGLRRVSIPEELSGTGLDAARSTRDDGWGVVTPDGARWFRLLPAAPEQMPAGFVLRALEFADDRPPAAAELALPLLSGYHALLMDPAGSTLYVVDFYAQTVQVVDGIELRVLRTVSFGSTRMKRPLCAATLSPDGSALFLLANDGNRGDGILALDVSSERPSEHFLPGRTLYCLAVSPDADRLYASQPTGANVPPATDPNLIAIDVSSGRELSSVALGLGDCCAWLMAVVDGET